MKKKKLRKIIADFVVENSMLKIENSKLREKLEAKVSTESITGKACPNCGVIELSAYTSMVGAISQGGPITSGEAHLV